MSDTYGDISCDGNDGTLSRFFCANCAEDDDRYDDYPTPLIGWLVDVLLFPALVFMGTMIAAMIATGSIWVTVRCWTDIVERLI